MDAKDPVDAADDEVDPVERALDEADELFKGEEGDLFLRALGNISAGTTIAKALKTSPMAGLWAAMKLKDSMFQTNEDRADFIRALLEEKSEQIKIKEDEACNDVFVGELEATLQKLEITEFADLLEEWKYDTDPTTPSLLPGMMNKKTPGTPIPPPINLRDSDDSDDDR